MIPPVPPTDQAVTFAFRNGLTHGTGFPVLAVPVRDEETPPRQFRKNQNTDFLLAADISTDISRHIKICPTLKIFFPFVITNFSGAPTGSCCAKAAQLEAAPPFPRDRTKISRESDLVPFSVSTQIPRVTLFSPQQEPLSSS